MNDTPISSAAPREFRILTSRLDQFKHRLEILNRRGAKLGCEPCTFAILRTEDEAQHAVASEGLEETDHQGRIVAPGARYVSGFINYTTLTVSGSAPKFAGWSLAACIERTEAGNLLRRAPNYNGPDLLAYRDAAIECQHCKLQRTRRDTFVVVHEDGERQLQVGRQCIKDFLGHNSPERIAQQAEWAFSVAELCADDDLCGSEGGGCGSEPQSSVAGVLTYAAMSIRLLGFVSRKAEEESMGQKQSTSSHVGYCMHPPRNAKRPPQPEDIDRERAELARDYVLRTLGGDVPRDSLSDFEFNLLVACSCETVARRNRGLLCFIPEYFARETEKRIRAEAEAKAPSVHYGQPGTRYKAQAIRYLKTAGFDSQFGYTYLHQFQIVAAGFTSRLVWKTGTEISYTAGENLVADFTVKAHGDYKGNLQTTITRLAPKDAAK